MRALHTVTATCHCVLENDHYHMEDEERLTTTGDRTGQREGTTTTTRIEKTAMTTIMQDRLQETYRQRERTTTSFERFIRPLTPNAICH